jgi:hypothetical protein
MNSLHYLCPATLGDHLHSRLKDTSDFAFRLKMQFALPIRDLGDERLYRFASWPSGTRL